MPRIVTVYTTPGCVQCKPTKKWLDDRDIPYTEVKLEESPEDAEAIKALGFKQAPVVIVSTGDPETDIMWSGLVVDNLKKYCHSTKEAA